MLKLIAASTFFAVNAAPLVIPGPEIASLPYLKAGKLQTLDSQKKQFQAGELWEKNGAFIYAVRRAGCPICRGLALDYSSLLPDLEARGAKLYAVVHEDKHAEKFRDYFKGDIFLDLDKTFYGPVLRYQNYLAFFSMISGWNGFKNSKKNIPGEKDGEARLLGATFIIGPGTSGIILQHNEMVAGDAVNLDNIKMAIEDIPFPY